MGEGVIPSKAIRVGPELVNIVRHLLGPYTVYLDVGGTAYHVLRSVRTSHSLVVRETPTPTCDLDYTVKVLSYDLEQSKEFGVYCIKSTAARAGKLTPAEVG